MEDIDEIKEKQRHLIKSLEFAHKSVETLAVRVEAQATDDLRAGESCEQPDKKKNPTIISYAATSHLAMLYSYIVI